MKQTLTFNLSTIASTESKIKVDYFDTSVEAFDNGEYLQSFYALLDYVNDEFREKYGNAKGTEFNIPHGSIVVNIKIENDWLLVSRSVSLFAGEESYSLITAGCRPEF